MHGSSENRMDEFSGNLISIRSGDTSFHIHEGLIKESATLLHSLWRKKETNGDTYSFSIPKEYSDAIQFYVNWIYRRTIPCVDSEQQMRNEWAILAKAYTVGKRFGDIDFQNAIINHVIERAKQRFNGNQILPNAETIQFTYEHAKECSKFKVLLVDLYASRAIRGYFCKTASSKYPKLFLIDVLSAVADMQHTGRASPTEGRTMDTCIRFHQHPQGNKCC
ncbi:hypothetical protein MGYG_06503 [Nannizzia gypsea CBS 118893]|uniref:BTB domain-containing protein n=1 Tax=Arthroderma gypseum (strain ATCC MYA-4604 / CBS 118893) TaxID=535722 RepID=E4UZH5_ARTGP|nr:hypothetical protein MGYG_06503 [Nannizzia gypsea CBS 118893]EFR03505.1 hypothetical protein MGYG_06503 [Nannizzia gypsea CBS 118893]